MTIDKQFEANLFKAINKCVEEQCEKGDVDFIVGDNFCSLMTDAAINVLKAQKDLYDYLKQEGELKN